MADARVIVVGAGIGGLVSALLLAQRGMRVQVLERSPAPGGKMRQVVVGGQAMDAGPTVLTMRWVFDRIFERAGSTLDASVKLERQSVLARHAWGTDDRLDRLDLHAEHARSVDAIGRFAGSAEAKRFDAFVTESQAVYRTLEMPYIRSTRPTLGSMVGALGARGMMQLSALGPMTSLWSLLARRFESPRLRQLFGRYATYCGASPWDAPATLMLVAQVEMQGVWSVDGGMHALARAIADLAARRGVEFSYDTAASRILVEQGRARGVETNDGRHWPADAVVFNGDADALAQGLLGPAVQHAARARPRSQRSLSAMTWSMLARTEGPDLVRHNVFFDDDYATEFADIGSGRLPRRGTVYLCAHDRGETATPQARAPGAAERLLMLVNAPANGDRGGPDETEMRRCEQSGLELLRRCGLHLQDPQAPSVRAGPQEFHRLYPASGGSLYGSATNGWMSTFRRPGSVTPIPGLFLAGGSVHPGPGVPMAALSGLLAAEALTGHLASTNPSSRVATSGGMSTRSATTDATA